MVRPFRAAAQFDLLPRARPGLELKRAFGADKGAQIYKPKRHASTLIATMHKNTDVRVALTDYLLESN
jgi:hypothetical protein